MDDSLERIKSLQIQLRILELQTRLTTGLKVDPPMPVERLQKIEKQLEQAVTWLRSDS